MSSKSIGRVKKIEQLISRHTGNPVNNHFTIFTDKGTALQSYDSIVTFREFGSGDVFLSPDWSYSVTTNKYRVQFLGEFKAETDKKIASGEYKLVDALVFS